MLLSLPRDLFTLTAVSLTYGEVNALTITCTDLYELCRDETIWTNLLQQRLGYYAGTATKERFRKYLCAGTPHVVHERLGSHSYNEEIQARRDVIKFVMEGDTMAVLTVEGQCFVFDQFKHVYRTTGVKDCALGVQYKWICTRTGQPEMFTEILVGIQRETCTEIVILDRHFKELRTIPTSFSKPSEAVASTLEEQTFHVRTTYVPSPFESGVRDKVTVFGRDFILYCNGDLVYPASTEPLLASRVITLCVDFIENDQLCYIREPQ